MSEGQHPQSRGFEVVADLYERARPGYPPEAVAWMADRLSLGPGKTVLDLGAGTGKLTRRLIATGSRVIAVEPGDEMRRELGQAVPAAEALAGAAEAIPLADESVDAVTVAQAFHWFRFDEALTEIGRVLRRGGGLGLIWNVRNAEDPLQRRISELITPLRPPGRPGAMESGWREAIEASSVFGEIEERSYPFAEELDADGLAARIATISFVAVAPEPQRAELERRLRELAGGGTVRFAYVAQSFVTMRVDRP